MTSKLKCPFCGQELLQEQNRDRDTEIYRCINCYFQGDGIIWQALIQSQKDLEIARKAMNQVMAMGAGNNICRNLKAKTVKSILGNALEQIEHKE